DADLGGLHRRRRLPSKRPWRPRRPWRRRRWWWRRRRIRRWWRWPARSLKPRDTETPRPAGYNPKLCQVIDSGEEFMAIERTLSIIKPDAVAKNVIGQIYAR